MRDPKNLIINFLKTNKIMGVEVKGAGDGVVIADRGCNDCYNRNKDQEIARLNRVVDAQRDQNIINQVVAALKGTTTPAQ